MRFTKCQIHDQWPDPLLWLVCLDTNCSYISFLLRPFSCFLWIGITLAGAPPLFSGRISSLKWNFMENNSLRPPSAFLSCFFPPAGTETFIFLYVFFFNHANSCWRPLTSQSCRGPSHLPLLRLLALTLIAHLIMPPCAPPELGAVWWVWLPWDGAQCPTGTQQKERNKRDKQAIQRQPLDQIRNLKCRGPQEQGANEGWKHLWSEMFYFLSQRIYRNKPPLWQRDDSASIATK